MPLSEDTIRLILDLGNSGKNVREVVDELEKLDVSTRKAGKSTGDFGRATLETGRIVQDFAQGGLGGIINNLEGFTQAIGLGAGAAGAITILGVAALTAAPAVKALWKEIVDGANAVPKAADGVVRLNDELATNKKRLGELKDQQTLSNAELVEFNKLTAEGVRLEHQLNEEKKRRSETEAARNQKTPDASALGPAFSKISGGADYNKIVGAASGLDPQTAEYLGMKREYDALNEKGKAEGTLSPEDRARYAELARGMNNLKVPMNVGTDPAINQKMNAAQDLVNKARGGDRTAFDQLRNQVSPDIRDQMNAIDPARAGGRAFNQQQAQTQIKDALGDLFQPLITALKEARANAKLSGDLTNQGRENEAATNKQQQDDAAARRAKAIANSRAAGRSMQPAGNPDADLAKIGQEQVQANNTLLHLTDLQDKGLITIAQAQQQQAIILGRLRDLDQKIRFIQDNERNLREQATRRPAVR